MTSKTRACIENRLYLYPFRVRLRVRGIRLRGRSLLYDSKPCPPETVPSPVPEARP